MRKRVLSFTLMFCILISLMLGLTLTAAAATPADPVLVGSAEAATAEGVTNSFYVTCNTDPTQKNTYTLTFTYSSDLADKLEFVVLPGGVIPEMLGVTSGMDVPASETPTGSDELSFWYKSISVYVHIKEIGEDTASGWVAGLTNYSDSNFSPFDRCIYLDEDEGYPLVLGETRPTDYSQEFYFAGSTIEWKTGGVAAPGTTFQPNTVYTAEIHLNFDNSNDATGLADDTFVVDYADSTTYDPVNQIITAVFSETYVTDDNYLMSYKYLADGENFDINGVFDGKWKQVTCYNEGFATRLQAGGDLYDISADGTAQAAGETGLTATVSCSLPAAYDGKIVAVTYTVENTGEGSLTYDLGSGGDIQIGADDAATITPFSDGSGFKMISGDDEDTSESGDHAQFNFFCSNTSGVTDVDKFWYGDYYEWDDDNPFGELQDLSPLTDNTDAAMTYCWTDRAISAGETQTYTVFFGVGGAGSENTVAGLFSNLTSATGTVTLSQTDGTPVSSFQATDFTVTADETTLAQSTDYTLSDLDTDHPSVTFLAAAGLTGESVVTITVAGVNDGNPITLRNTIPVEIYTSVYVNGIDIGEGGYWRNGDTTAASGTEDDYNFYFDADTNTLYLNNADITNCAYLNDSFSFGYNEGRDDGVYGIYTDGIDLYLVLTGTNTITPSDEINGFNYFGVFVQNGDLTVSGSGSLSVEKTNDTTFGVGIVVNQNGNLNITGGTVNATGDYGGINVYHWPYSGEYEGGTGTPSDTGCINFSGGTVNAYTVGNDYSYAFACDGDLNITGTTANVMADAMFGIYSDNGVINIEQGHAITGDETNFATTPEVQTQWDGRFFRNYGCIYVVNGVLNNAVRSYQIYFYYGDNPEDYAEGCCLLGDTITLPTGITKDGYTLSGWYTEENGAGTRVTGSTVLTAELLNGETYLVLYANWTANGTSGNHHDSTPDNSEVIVDGVGYNIGSLNTAGGTTILTPDQSQLGQRIGSAAQGGEVVVPLTLGDSVSSGAAALVLQNIEDMAKKEMTLSVQVDDIAYNLPTAAVDTESIMEQLGATDSAAVRFTVTVIKLSADDVTVRNGELVVPPVEFTVMASCNGKSIEVEQFSDYVERIIAIPDGVDPDEITTAVVIGADGSERHVPTEVFLGSDGKYYAKINSLTNSTYALVWNPVQFSDVEGHWAKDSVNNMGSRMVMNGIGNNNFAPDRDMTRAEFAAVIVRALGLEPGAGDDGFSDIGSNDWYCGYIETAAEYGIITGYSDGTFGPNDLITREQAMTMIARAMQITGLEAGLADGDIAGLLGAYADGKDVSAYAQESIAACLKAGVVTGRSASIIAPQDCITRAEIAVIVERLLQKSELI